MTTTDLSGKTVAFLATDGYEDSELTSPWNALLLAGAKPVLVSPKIGAVEGKNGHLQRVDVSAASAAAADYDALVLPGGVVNADHLRMDEDSVAFAKEFFATQKPVGAICHAAWTLVEAGVVDGRTLTSYPSLRTDLRNAGATWVDEEVVVDDGLVSSRTPDDLPAFNAKLVEEIARGGAARRSDGVAGSADLAGPAAAGCAFAEHGEELRTTVFGLVVERGERRRRRGARL